MPKTKATTNDLESFAASRGKPFTTAQAAKALGETSRSVAALLACRNRDGRRSGIIAAGPGRWDYVQGGADALPENLTADERAALEGLEALVRLNGSASKIIALALVREAFRSPGKVVKFGVLPLTPNLDATNKVRTEVARLLAEKPTANFTVNADSFAVVPHA